MTNRFRSPAGWGVTLCLAVLCSVSLPAGLSGQTTTAPVRDPNALALAARALQAISPNAALSDITLQGTVNYTAGSDEEGGTVTLVALGNQMSLASLSLTGGSRQEIRNGPLGVWTGPNGVPTAMATYNCVVDASWFFPALALQGLSSDPTLGAIDLGPAEWSGVSAVHLQFSHVLPGQAAAATAQLQGLSTLDLYLDPQTLLPLALDFNAHPDNNVNVNIPVEIQFGSYRTVNGVQVPFRVQKLFQGTLQLDIFVSQVAINSGVSSSIFTLPQLPSGGAQ